MRSFENVPDKITAQLFSLRKDCFRGPVSPAGIIAVADIGHDEVRGYLVPRVALDELDAALAVFDDQGSTGAVRDRNPGPFQGGNIVLFKKCLDVLASRARAQEDHQDHSLEGRLAGVGLPTGRSERIGIDEESLIVHPALDGHVVITEHHPAVIASRGGEKGRDGLRMIAVFVVSRKDKPVTCRHDDGAAEGVREIPGIEELRDALVRPMVNLWDRIGRAGSEGNRKQAPI